MTSMWNRVPARTRLMLWFSILLGTMLVSLGLVALWLVDYVLTSNGDELLMDKATAIEVETSMARNRLTFESAEVPLIAGLEVVRIWDRDHHLIFDQEGAPEVGMPSSQTIDAWLGGTVEFGDARDARGSPIRLYAKPVVQRDRVIGALQIGRARADQESVLGHLRSYGLVGLIVALLLAWRGGHWLAEQVFRPITAITNEAQRIDAEALSRRLTVPSADDELRCLALAFNSMIERLDTAFGQQRQFTADASHELRTPLAVLRSEIEVALSHPRESGYDTAAFGRLGDEAERLTRIVENLLALAQADSGAVLAHDRIDLQELVADAGARFTPRARARCVRFQLTLGDAGQISGDALWLTQLLTNLLENALRHSPNDGTITLQLSSSAAEVEVSVSDTGEGIAPEHLPHIFERFYRADGARDRATGGAGLGLAICDWVARSHGGAIDVTSEPGRGTTFTLRLPAITTSSLDAPWAIERSPAGVA
jgi:heavy metal sensor kinase